MSETEVLTGRKRYRSGNKGRAIVLQVEYQYIMAWGEKRLAWRDATLEDISRGTVYEPTTD